MRNIGIVGAGQGGLQLGFGLLAQGYGVTIYSDRTSAEVLSGRLTSTAFVFHRALDHERDLGLDFWRDEVELGEGVHLDYSPTPRKRLVSVAGRFLRPGAAVDQRLKFARLMDMFEARGGRLLVGSVEPTDLDRLAGVHDLLVVATGKGSLSGVFERDPERSPHDRPQRRLALLTLQGLEPWAEIPFRVAKFTLFGSEGEIFWIPFHDKTIGTCYSVVFEAKPGSRLDRFGAARTGDDAIRIAREVVADLAPWESHRLRRIELTDPLAWATGAVTPVVRKPVVQLGPGRFAMGLGDALVLNDPIAAQGANHAIKAAHFLVDRIVERGDRPFDARWVNEGFEEFWRREARHMVDFSNLFLAPIEPPAKEILLAASREPAVAEEFFEGFNAPHTLWPWIDDLGMARRKVADRTGRPWIRTATAARFQVLGNQIKDRIGRSGGRTAASGLAARQTGRAGRSTPERAA